jgi:hypothetical protein
MLPVFDCPGIPCVDGEVAGPGEAGGEAGDAGGDFLALPGSAGGPGVSADAQDLGGVRPVDAVGRGGADAALLAAPWPLPWSVQVVSANCASVPASLLMMAPRRDGWFALMIISSLSRRVFNVRRSARSAGCPGNAPGPRPSERADRNGILRTAPRQGGVPATTNGGCPLAIASCSVVL